MNIVHLTASTLFGGPERQMLGLAEHLPPDCRTRFVSFREGGRCGPFLDEVRRRGFPGDALEADFPRLRSVLAELTEYLKVHRADVLLTHSYKPNLLGRIAARRVGIPVVSVSRGWTAENWKVRRYEQLDRFNLRFMDHVVAVSDAQAAKVRACRVPDERLSVVRNSCRFPDFTGSDLGYETRLQAYFAAETAVSHLVISAGRLSPEKGFDLLVTAAAEVLKQHPTAGFIHFGEGVDRPKIEAMIRAAKLTDRFVLAGFTTELDHFLPFADLFVLPSYTEGLPNVALEAAAAEVAVVATAVGGTPEVVADGQTGLLVPPGRPPELARAILDLLKQDAKRMAFGRAGRERMRADFTFEGQAAAYQKLFAKLCPPPVLLQRRVTCTPPYPAPGPKRPTLFERIVRFR